MIRLKGDMMEEQQGSGKKYWRCTVCQDIHFGVNGPEKCPTCQQINTYVEIDKEESKKALEMQE